MATFFGEVTYISSRAYDEDEDDEELIKERYDLELNLKDQNQSKGKINSVIISYGTLANDYLQICIDSSQCSIIGDIQIKKESELQPEDTGDFHPRVLQPCKLLISSTGALLCQCPSTILPSLTPKFSKKLLSLTDRTCPVLVLASYHYSKLNGNCHSFDNEYFLAHTLKTSNFESHTPAYSHLPQPSTLDSLPAAVTTECVISKRPCVVYCAYTETFSSGDVDLVAEPFTKALSASPFQNSLNVNLNNLNKRTPRAKSEMVDRYM